MKSKIYLIGFILSFYLSAQAQLLPGLGQVPVIDTEGLSTDMLAPNEGQAGTTANFRAATAGEIDLGSDMFLLSNTDDPNSSLAVVTVTDAQWNNLRASATYSPELKVITNKVYTKFKDNYDFIFLVLDTLESNVILTSLGFYGVNWSVSNAVQGTGKSIYNNCAAWGSAGKLKSVMYFPYGAAIRNGPTLHELSHNWGAYMCPTFNKDGSAYNGHWGVSNAGGQLGGFRYVRTVETNSGGVIGKTRYQGSFKSSATNPDGSFVYGGFGVNANGGNGLPYSDIELYTMGMKSAQELRDAGFHLDIYSGNTVDAASSTGYFCSTTLTSYTIDDLIALKGARVPDAAASQKNFKILTVAITKAGIPSHQFSEIISAVNWLAGPVSDNTYSYLYNFRQATYDRGTLVTTGISSDLKTTAIHETKASSLKVYPTCVTDAFVVSGFSGNATLMLYDVNGQLLVQKQVSAETSIPVSQLASGVYLVRVHTAEGVLQTKLIKR